MSLETSSRSRIQQVAAAIIGNALEWYDFIIYGFMTGVISKQFFPADGQEYTSLLLATATFGAGFVMRPVGGVLLGVYADRKGRKAALQLIMGLMSLAILIIVLAPPYAAIGVAAPALILLARLIQGFATGGEYASSTAFLVEMAPPGKHGLYGSWQLFGQSLAVLTGAAMGALVSYAFTPPQLEAWAWRLPFVFGLLIVPVGLWMRRHMEETEAFVHASRQPAATPLALGLAGNMGGMWTTLALIVPGTAVFYVVLISMPGYASRQFGLPLEQAFAAQTVAVAVLTLVTPLSGWWSDRIGRWPILLGAQGMMLLLVYPLFWWLEQTPSIERLLAVQVTMCVLQGLCNGPVPAAVSELFPVKVRSTAMSISYNLAVMLFGGFAPFIVTLLTQHSGSSLAPAFYLMFCLPIGLLGAYRLRTPARAVGFESRGQPPHKEGASRV